MAERPRHRRRIGTLDLRSAELDGAELRGIRIDDLALPAARHAWPAGRRLRDPAPHLPEATSTRVLFEDTRADEVDTRGLRRETSTCAVEAVS